MKGFFFTSPLLVIKNKSTVCCCKCASKMAKFFAQLHVNIHVTRGTEAGEQEGEKGQSGKGNTLTNGQKLPSPK